MENVATRPQQGMTCWFHAIINGLIMSWKSRGLVKRKIPTVMTNIGGKSIFNNSDFCPTKSTSGNLFWNYINHRIRTRGTVNSRYVNANVIRNLGVRKHTFNVTGLVPRLSNTKRTYLKRVARSRSGVWGGTFSDVLNVYDKIFPKEVSMLSEHKPTTFVIKKGNQFDKVIKHANVRYELSHAYIQVMVPGSFLGHAMTGYISTKGNYNVYDSGTNVTLTDIGWPLDASNIHIINWVRDSYHIPARKNTAQDASGGP